MKRSVLIKALPTVAVATIFSGAFTQFDRIKATSFQNIPFVINVTNSMPVGFYRLDTNKLSTFSVGDIVYFPVPLGHQSILYDRAYLQPGAHLIKPVAAIAGDHVCIDDNMLWVNNTSSVVIFVQDNLGRTLPQLSFCRVLERGELFILSEYSKQSYDSRYFGPVLEENVIAKAHLFVTFGALASTILATILGIFLFPLSRRGRSLGGKND